jgi:ethanolamine utilization protein EutA (predicted chaperonin)
VIKNEIIESGIDSFLFTEGNIFSLWNFAEVFIPFVFELFFRNEMIVDYSCLNYKGRCVSTNSNFLIDFSHIPFKFIRSECGYVCWDEANIDITEFFELILKLSAVKFIRIVHNITIVDGSNYQVLLILHSV